MNDQSIWIFSDPFWIIYNLIVNTVKSRDTTLLTKVRLVKAMVFPVVMYGCESWTIEKVERGRIDASELCWRRFLRVPWTARKSHQSIVKETNPEYSLEGLMLKLKLIIKWLLISWLQSPSAVTLEPKKIKSVHVSIVSLSICHSVIGLVALMFIDDGSSAFRILL